VLRGSTRRAALLLASGAALLAGGCGSAHKPTPVGLKLQREDFALATRSLASVEQAVEREGQAAKATWPLILAGLPSPGDAAAHTRIHQTAVLAGALPLPPLFEEEPARGLIGTAAGVAGTYATFYHLATRAWRLIDYSFDQVSQGSASAASFARANVALYIESVYDAQFVLAQIGKQLVSGYKRLGGPQEFGATLTQAELDGLADVYSESTFELKPHGVARLGY
jgi:hypothetical protein